MRSSRGYEHNRGSSQRREKQLAEHAAKQSAEARFNAVVHLMSEGEKWALLCAPTKRTARVRRFILDRLQKRGAIPAEQSPEPA
jgi:hypothetical protein